MNCKPKSKLKGKKFPVINYSTGIKIDANPGLA